MSERDELERENALLRARVDALEARGELRHRRRVAMILIAGGVLAIGAGIFGSGVLVVALGAGWLFGGAAVASTLGGER